MTAGSADVMGLPPDSRSGVRIRRLDLDPGSLEHNIRRVRRRVTAAVVVLVVLFSAGAALILHAETQQRDALASRFDSRQATALNFIAAYVTKVFEREKVLSARSFAGPVITQQFANAAGDQGYAAAVLLDARGRLLASQPDNPASVGRDLTTRYTHLRSAVAGKAAVSGVVPSAVRGLPVVGFAVPFQTPTGRRVFSGGYPVGDTPVALFVRNAVPFHTANIVIVDAAGIIVASNDPTTAGRPLAVANPQLAPVDAATSYIGSGTERRYLTQSGIPGTPWKLIFAVTTDELFAPLEGPVIWIPWLALVAFFVASLLALAIFYPYLTQRARLVESDARRRAILDTAEDGFVSMDEGGRITEWNTAATRLLGWGFTEAIGKPLADLIIPPAHRQAHRDGLAHFLATGQPLLQAGPMQVQAVRRDGTLLDLEFALSRLRWERGWHFHAFLRDISERLELEAELRKFALTDALTGLANRRAALERLDQAVARAQRRHNPIAVLFIDVDKFKAVNDTHGHAAGDAVLITLTGRLHAMFRTEDTVARLGGDEFLVICEDLASDEAARELAERTQTILAQPYPVAGQNLHITASVGLALSDADSTAEGLLNHADTEMYTAKAARRTFDEITNPTSRHR